MALLNILIILSAVLLVLIVLIQNSKGGGLDANLASQNNSFGAKKTTEIVEKATWTLVSVLIVLSIVYTKQISTSGDEFDDEATTEQFDDIDADVEDDLDDN